MRSEPVSWNGGGNWLCKHTAPAQPLAAVGGRGSRGFPCFVHRMEEGIEGATVTPYEKNLGIWKQLWHVLERADVVIQILDGRNPLMYR